MADPPGVTVVIPARDAADTIEDAVRSALGQTLDDLEVLVIDDGSTDATRRVVETIGDPRLRLTSVPHRGVSAARNEGIRQARGRVIGFLDADDVWLERRMEVLVAALDTHPGAGVAYSWVDRVEGDRHSPHSRQAVSGDVAQAHLEAHLLSIGSNIVATADALRAVGGFDETLDFAEDWDLGVRLAQHVEFVAVEEVLVHYRRHGGNATRRLREVHRGYRRAARAWDRLADPRLDHRRARRLRAWRQYRWLAHSAAHNGRSRTERALGGWWLTRHVVACATAPQQPWPRLDPGFVRNCARTLWRPHPPTTTVSRQLRHLGYVAQSEEISDPSVLDDLVADEAEFRRALARIAESDDTRVPYLVTDAIARVTFDPNVVDYVNRAFDGAPWVMWGANIRTGIPNAAHEWHDDMESREWPCLTMVIGLAGCHEHNATGYLPGSHRLRRRPPAGVAFADAAVALEAARNENPACREVATFSGFGNGRFYGFDARGWHCGDPATGEKRVLLFTHFQKAGDRRIPEMKDFRRGEYVDRPAAYLSCFDWPDRTQPPPTAPSPHPAVETRLARPAADRGAWRHAAQRWRSRMGRVVRRTRSAIGRRIRR